MSQFRVVHVMRAPVGGLFRHVRDLVTAQQAMGLDVGVICDSQAADRLTEERLEALKPRLSMGLERVAMSRDLGPSDLMAWRAVHRIGMERNVDVLHGHGAKGGAYARLAAASLRRSGHPVACFYTPHGGSLHYKPSSLKGRLFMALERRLAQHTSGLIFESAFSARAYAAQVGDPVCPVRVIPNGLLPEEFGEHRPETDAADVLFVGELRMLKGVDVLLEALASMARTRPVDAVIVGDGPDRAAFEAKAAALGLREHVRFPGAMPAQRAFPAGRVLVVPSRAESLPYIVLEAAAGAVPLVATDVGGIPEIVAGTDTELVPPDNASALAQALTAAINAPQAAVERAKRLKQAVFERFSVVAMAGSIADFYASARN